MANEAEYETRIIRQFVGLTVEEPDDPKEPTILRLRVETNTGPLDVRIARIAASELTAALSTHPLTRGSA